MRPSPRKILWMLAMLLVAAVPVWSTTIAAPDPFELRQPDGTHFVAVAHGDIHNSWIETKEGHTIIQQGGFWYYADLKENRLVASPYRVGATSESLLAGRPRHLAPSVDPSVYDTYTPTPIEPDAVFNQNVLVVLLAFADTPMYYSQSSWVSQFFGATGSVKEHYLQMSGNNFVITAAAETQGTTNDGVIAITLGYNHPNMGQGGMGTTVQDALTAADPYINYAAYDADANGSISAKELSVIFILSGYEAAYSPAPAPNSWAHASSVTPFTLDGKQLSPYARFGERQSTHQATIGVMSHELGHLMLGLPDLYDRTPGGAADSEGVGKWCLMASGSWNTSGGFSGSTPGHMLAWSKIKSGFGTATDITSSGTGVTIAPADTGLFMKRIWIDKYRVRESFLLESRRLSGYDAGLPGPGLVITHIDNLVATQNDDETHKLVDIEEADGLNGLDNSTNRGDAGDPYPGSSVNITFNDISNPNSKDYTSASTGVAVTNILDTGGGTMSFDVNPGSGGNGDNVRYDQEKRASLGTAYGSATNFYTGLTVQNTTAYNTLDGFEVYLYDQGYTFTVEARIYQSLSGGVPQTLLYSQTFSGINALTSPWSRLMLTTPQPFPPNEERFVVFRISCCTQTWVYYSATSPVSGRSYQSSTGASFVARTGGDWSQIALFGGSSGCTPPGAPTLSSATPACSGTNLAWTAGSGATNSYNVYRFAGACGGTYTKIAGPLSAATLNYSDTSAVGGTSYAYVIRGACDTGGLGESVNSNCRTATRLAIPAAPTGVSATPSCTGTSVSWTNSPGATSHNVLRGTVCGTVVTTFTGVTTPYNDATGVPGTAYNYWVVGINSCGTGANSSCASVTTGGLPTFGGVTSVVNPGSATCTLNLAWAAGTSNCGGTITYNIYRNQGAAPVPPAGQIAAGVSGTGYSDTNALSNGLPYYYIVRAKDSANGLEDSNLVAMSATPTGPLGAPTNIFTENFDNAIVGWAQGTLSGTAAWTISAGTIHPVGGGAHSGANVARFDSYDAPAGNQARLLRTSGVNLSAAGAASVSFWMYHDVEYTENDTLQVQTSTNLGASWQSRGSAISRYTGGTGWTLHTVDLAPVAGFADVRIAFLGTSAYGNDCYIDDVTISSTSMGTCTTGGAAPPEIAPGTTQGTAQSWTNKNTVTWPSNAAATSYTLYRGVLANLPALLTGSQDSCTKYTGATNSTATVTEDPTAVAGRFYWYLVTGSNGSGEGTAGNATAGARTVNTSGACL